MAEEPRRDAGDQGGAARPTRQPGLREVLLVAAGVVLTVLAAAAATSLLPADLRSVVTDTPLAIVVLVAVTAAVLLRVARSGSS